MRAIDTFNHVSTFETRCEQLETMLREREQAYENELSKKEAQFTSALHQLRERMVDVTKFSAVTVTTEEVARFHGVSTARVRDYARRGLLEIHPNSTDAKLLFRASSALRFDFGELKKAKLILKR